MIIIVNDWKKKLVRLAVAVVIITAFVFTIPLSIAQAGTGWRLVSGRTPQRQSHAGGAV